MGNLIFDPPPPKNMYIYNGFMTSEADIFEGDNNIHCILTSQHRIGNGTHDLIELKCPVSHHYSLPMPTIQFHPR